MDKRLRRRREGLKPIIINDFPQEVWVKARMKSIRIGKPMNKVILEMLMRWVEEEEKDNK